MLKNVKLEYDRNLNLFFLVLILQMSCDLTPGETTPCEASAPSISDIPGGLNISDVCMEDISLKEQGEQGEKREQDSKEQDSKDYDESDDENTTYDIGACVRIWKKYTKEWSNGIYRIKKVNKYRNTYKLITLDDGILKGWYKHSSLKYQKITGLKNLQPRDVTAFVCYNKNDTIKFNELDEFMNKTSTEHIKSRSFNGQKWEELEKYVLSFYSKHGYLCEFMDLKKGIIQMKKIQHKPRDYSGQSVYYDFIHDDNGVKRYTYEFAK